MNSSAWRQESTAVDDPRDPDVLHELKNHLFVVVAYCKILLAEVPETDPRYMDIVEIDTAIRAAVGLLGEVDKRMR